MKKPIAERLKEIQERKSKLVARENALIARAKTDERKHDTRCKIIIGGAVLAHMEFDPAFADAIRIVLHKAVTRDQDLKTLGELLTPAPALHAS